MQCNEMEAGELGSTYPWKESSAVWTLYEPFFDGARATLLAQPW